MTRNYHRKVVGSRHLFNYTEVNLKKAILDYKNNRGSLRTIAEKYGVPKSTLERKVKNLNMGKHGGQTMLSAEEEQVLVKCILMCAEWGFPFRMHEIGQIVKSYLDREGRIVQQFHDNTPGKEWCKRFMKSHPELTARMSENIKRCRAAITPEVIRDYFRKLEESIDGIPPENLLNGDETNFVDDPKSTKVIVRRGSRRAEYIVDHSKSATTVMFTVSGAGDLLPPYVVYKAKYLYPTWVEAGPEGAFYNASGSGWFDMAIFEDYFEKVVVPYFKNKEGKKGYVCDNVAFHASFRVLELCEEHGIFFVFLPPNATHLTQPLDVGTFRPLKAAWRGILADWKKTNRGVIPKSVFPSLLKKAIEKCFSMESNIRASFKACGLIPLNPEQVLKRLPRDSCDGGESSTAGEVLDGYDFEPPQDSSCAGKKLRSKRKAS